MLGKGGRKCIRWEGRQRKKEKRKKIRFPKIFLGIFFLLSPYTIFILNLRQGSCCHTDLAFSLVLWRWSLHAGCFCLVAFAADIVFESLLQLLVAVLNVAALAVVVNDAVAALAVVVNDAVTVLAVVSDAVAAIVDASKDAVAALVDFVNDAVAVLADVENDDVAALADVVSDAVAALAVVVSDAVAALVDVLKDDVAAIVDILNDTIDCCPSCCK